MNKLELIEKYIQDSASPTEMAAIKKLMSEDEAFKKEVHFHLALRLGVQQEERSRLKEQLQAIEHSKSRLNWKASLGKVAAMLLLSVGVIWLFLKPSKHEKLYDKYFEPYTNIVAPTVRGSNSYSENVKI